ncbi:hypothetical protein SAY87_025581 [Trapa incisa]|uniref:Uncharacterized protein n=1 Tax=Trapa incisa TaxID=236973 RepID=A0AAN7GLM8_9MYRT|nr:hypothetical protein SAY87_025581 [Trapa incisa]
MNGRVIVEVGPSRLATAAGLRENGVAFVVLDSSGDGCASQMDGALKWITLAIQAVFIASEAIVSLELFYLSTFRCIKAICGTLGFELLLWSIVSFQTTLIINGALFAVAAIRSFRRELLRIQPDNIIHMIDGEPLGAAATASPLDQAGSDLIGDDLV